jgi:hypothetical protein
MNKQIAAAFAELDRRGIIALQNAGYTMSDGWSDVAEQRHRAEQKGRVMRGGVFYHGQDAARARAGGPLYLAFGSFADDPEHEPLSLALARETCEVLLAHGLKTTWNGSIDSRIAITPPAKTNKKAAKKSTKKTTTKKSTKKTTTKKSAAKKTPAKKTTKKAPAKKPTKKSAKKPPAKKAAKKAVRG